MARFGDEDRQRLRDEERANRLYREFLWEYDVRHARQAPDVPMTPELIRKIEAGLDPRPRLGRTDDAS